jgi:formimidoylglutamate deiminase
MSQPSPAAALWAPQAWVQGAWAPQVLLHVDADGRWADIKPNTPPPPGAQVLPMPVLPGLVNAHSHAFQRAFVGLAERRDGAQDNFWSWRDRMYGVALRITPEQLQTVATHLFGELVQGGYTQVCEFHYLHHQEDGQPYADEATMCRVLAQAAQNTGIGLTLLPVVYQRAGFQQPSLRADQRRFAADVQRVLRLRDQVRSWSLPGVTAGVAVHSLRAVSAEALHDLSAQLRGDPGPVHIHIAEQTAEVDDCLAATGQRPLQWLAHSGMLDARWQLVHATHSTPDEIKAVAATGAGVVLCPSTEANLGDGLCDLPAWLAAGVPLALGSDSHVVRQWPEELRWLDYGQRLALRQRNVAAAPPAQPSTAARLFDLCCASGVQAAGLVADPGVIAAPGASGGLPAHGLQAGARADLLLLNAQDPALSGMPTTHGLDAAVFAAAAMPFAGAMVAGRWLPLHDTREHMAAVMRDLWSALP